MQYRRLPATLARGRRASIASAIALAALAPACAHSTSAAEASPTAVPAAEATAAPAQRAIRWGQEVLRQAPGWYGSAEARRIADSVLLYQSPQGGWPKNIDLSVMPASPADVPQPGDGSANTFDNDATTLPMEFLARVIAATGDDRYLQAFERGFDYTLAAQYPNGGWPQFYPLREGYYSHITFNDDAMVRVMTLLRDAASGQPPYGFVDADRRRKAAAAVDRGIALILRTQVVQDGKPTAWSAQHDVVTLKPAWARRFEPPSLSGNESVGIVRFLMGIDNPSPAVVAAVEGAVDWFRRVAIPDARVEQFIDSEGNPDRRMVREAGAGPIWARFYELGTDRPIFLGRDSVVRYSLAEIERERRAGYHYLGTWPDRLLRQDYPAWRARIGRPLAGR